MQIKETLKMEVFVIFLNSSSAMYLDACGQVIWKKKCISTYFSSKHVRFGDYSRTVSTMHNMVYAKIVD